MSLRIFETDETARAPKRVQYDTPDFRLKGGLLVNNRPVALSTWAFTTDESETADYLAQTFGGEIEVLDVEKGDDQQIVTEAASIDVLLSGPKALSSVMVLYGMDRKPIHRCDGMFSLLDDDKGEPCGCPPEFKARKDRANNGRGPKPEIKLNFQLADNPELGIGLYRTGSWTLVRDLPEIEAELEARQGDEPIAAKLKLVHVEFVTNAGMNVSYYRPVVEFP